MHYILDRTSRASDLKPGDRVWKGYNGCIRHLSAVVIIEQVEMVWGGFLIQAKHPDLGTISPGFAPDETVSVMRENWLVESKQVGGDAVLAAFEGLVQPESEEEVEAARWSEFFGL